jgi:type IV pilus assembly protein PilX
MAGNIKDRNLAFQAAEAALRDADAWLYSLPRAPQTPEVPEEISCNPLSPPAPFENVYAPGTLCDVDSVDYDWSNLAIQYDRLQSGDLGTDHINTCDPDTAPPDDSVFNKQLAAHPCILIEKYDFIPDDMNPDTRAKQIGRQYFRITVLGFGGTSAAQSVIQTILFQRYN